MGFHCNGLGFGHRFFVHHFDCFQRDFLCSFLQARFFLNDGCVKIYWFSFKIIIFFEGQRIMQDVFRLRFLLGGPSF